MQLIRLLAVLALAFLMTHCASYDFSRRVAEQGNLISPKVTQRLKIGMSKEDVAILMGTSLLSPTFTNDRWDYAFTRRKGSGHLYVRNLVLFFKNNQLVRIESKP